MTEENVTISKKEYDQLQDDSALLAFLRNHGVDNWCGWDDASTDYWAWKGDE
jgi:hypothetical protein